MVAEDAIELGEFLGVVEEHLPQHGLWLVAVAHLLPQTRQQLVVAIEDQLHRREQHL